MMAANEFVSDAIHCVQSGGKLVFFGNGGSAAESQHMAAEYVNRFRFDRNPISAISLTVDTSVLTSIANDYAFDQIFARQVRAICESRDMVVGISTSGRSANVLAGLQEASRIESVTWLLTGIDAPANTTFALKVLSFPSNDTPRIQEMQTIFGHSVAEMVEQHIHG